MEPVVTGVPVVPVMQLPSYAGPSPMLQPAYAGDAGYDVYATEDAIVMPGQVVVMPVGIALALPALLEAQVRSKSGLTAHHRMVVLNSPGTIDPPYRGEVGVILMNAHPVVSATVFDKLLDVLDGNAEVPDLRDLFEAYTARTAYRVAKGTKVAQLVCAQFVHPLFQQVNTLPGSVRDAAGFGSSGV